jgi:Na+/H+ antiporter NhaD/arsenite permease-like protein
MDVWIAGGIFLVTYALIASERFDRTALALLGGLGMIVLGVLDQAEAFAAIDLNVIFLLAGMMVLAGPLRRTGFFEWIAIRSVRASRGRPVSLLIILSVVTAILSAFLDNVTTVVLMTPITLSVAHRLGVSPLPYLISQIIASNIGGTATLIGDPPNILIGSAAGLDFGDFLANVGPVTVVILAVTLGMLGLLFRRGLGVPDERRESALEAMEPSVIRDRGLLVRTLAVVGMVMVALVLHGPLGLEPATIALLGAAVLILVGSLDPGEALREVEWSTLFFFVGLFILVDGIVKVGIIDGVAGAIAEATGGDEGAATMALLWFSGIASAIVDNIPYTATAIPVVDRLIGEGLVGEPLWWALSLGACLGGNLTIIGASANVVVANLALRSGEPIGFWQYLRYGSIAFVASMVISTLYLWLRYLT